MKKKRGKNRKKALKKGPLNPNKPKWAKKNENIIHLYTRQHYSKIYKLILKSKTEIKICQNVTIRIHTKNVNTQNQKRTKKINTNGHNMCIWYMRNVHVINQFLSSQLRQKSFHGEVTHSWHYWDNRPEQISLSLAFYYFECIHVPSSKKKRSHRAQHI